MSAAEWPRVGPIDAAVVRPNLSGDGTMSDQCECEACQRTYGRAGGQPVGQTRHADVERVERPLSLTDFLLARIAEDEAVRGRKVTDYARVLREGGFQAGLALMILERMALPYADHPDWREEWKP